MWNRECVLGALLCGMRTVIMDPLELDHGALTYWTRNQGLILYEWEPMKADEKKRKNKMCSAICTSIERGKNRGLKTQPRVRIHESRYLVYCWSPF